MSNDRGEIGLLRFVRQIRLISERPRATPTERSTDVGRSLGSFTGILRPHLDAQQRRVPELSYLLLRPLRLTERVETVREVHAPTKPDREAVTLRRPTPANAGSEQSDLRTRYERRTVESRIGRQTPLAVTDTFRRFERNGSSSQTTASTARAFHHEQPRPAEGEYARLSGETEASPSSDPRAPHSKDTHDRRRTDEGGVPGDGDGRPGDGARGFLRRRRTRWTPPRIAREIVLPALSGTTTGLRFTTARKSDHSDPGGTARRRSHGRRFRRSPPSGPRYQTQSKSKALEARQRERTAPRGPLPPNASRHGEATGRPGQNGSVAAPTRTRAPTILRDGSRRHESSPSDGASFAVVDRTRPLTLEGRSRGSEPSEGQFAHDRIARNVPWRRAEDRTTDTDSSRSTTSPQRSTSRTANTVAPRSVTNRGPPPSRERTRRGRAPERTLLKPFETATEAARGDGEASIGETSIRVEVSDDDGGEPVTGGRPNQTGGSERRANETAVRPEIRTTLSALRPAIRRVGSTPTHADALLGRRTTVLHAGTEAATSGPGSGEDGAFGQKARSLGDAIPTGHLALSVPSSSASATVTPSNQKPALTVRADRRTGDPDEPTPHPSRESPERSFSRENLNVESINKREENISPLEPIDGRHMNADVDLDRLVDRLYDRFEQKLRTERQRRGL